VRVTASSWLPAHPPRDAADGDTTTFWATNQGNKDVPGSGQWIELDYAGVAKIASFSILTGDQYPPSDFRNAGRPSKVELEFSSGSSVTFKLADSESFQRFTFVARQSHYLKIVILSVYPGNARDRRWSFCAITEAAAYSSISTPG